MAFVSTTLGKLKNQHRVPRGKGFPQIRLNGVGAAAARTVFRPKVTVRLHGLGDVTCSIDPATGGRVCSDGSTSVASSAAQANAPIPGGSYTFSCRNARTSGDALYAECYNPSTNSYNGVALPGISACSGGDIQNNAGKLQCCDKTSPPGQCNPWPAPAVQAPAAQTIQPAGSTAAPSNFVSSAPAMIAAPKPPTDWVKLGIIGVGSLVGIAVLKKVLK